MTANSTISVWPILGGLFVIGIGYYAYQYYRKRKPHTNNNVTSELKSKIKYFSGSINALWDVSKKPDLSLSKVTFDNIQQIIDIQGSDTIKKWYSDFGKDRNSWDIVLYKSKANELINILKACGIHSHNEKEFIWDNESSKKYNKLTQIQNGQKCIVVVPYWIYEGDVFEKGLVKVK